MSSHELSQLATTLIKAKRHILDVENWCQGQMRNGYARCAWGAIEWAADAFNSRKGYDAYNEALMALEAASMEKFGISAVGVNDHMGFSAVHEVYDRAIQKAIKP
jgi:hypothetical protein